MFDAKRKKCPKNMLPNGGLFDGDESHEIESHLKQTKVVGSHMAL